jgi:hypothetical protein
MVGMEGRQIIVDEAQLRDLLDLVDAVLAHCVDDQFRDKANIRDVPLAVTDGLRGAAAQIRCGALLVPA